MVKNTSRLQCVIPNSSLDSSMRNSTPEPALVVAPFSSPTDPNMVYGSNNLLGWYVLPHLIQGSTKNIKYSAQISYVVVLISQICTLCWNISKRTMSWCWHLMVKKVDYCSPHYLY